MNSCLNCGSLTSNKKFCSISCQNSQQNADKANKKWGVFKQFDVSCNCCKTTFSTLEREFLFPKKDLNKYYCGRSCANKKQCSQETKLKIQLSLTKEKIKICCEFCKNDFFIRPGKSKQRFCSRPCSSSWKNLNLGFCTKAGLASVKAQSATRRSKNEIHFYELCKSKFENVLMNEGIFNGWDADVIIEDIKFAILWNGKWHYEKLKKDHSVAQVQNRDRIKMGEIEKCGYTPYVIKDMGKQNPSFVEEQFEIFIAFLEEKNILVNLKKIVYL